MQIFVITKHDYDYHEFTDLIGATIDESKVETIIEKDNQKTLPIFYEKDFQANPNLSNELLQKEREHYQVTVFEEQQ
jgi:hypothetical protein